jgi:Tfp pilus assembly protein PilX
MYQRITDENPYKAPMRIYPAVHYTMGGLWVDYNLMSTVPGLHVLGEANFSDHGANRLGASALMQGLADGYFVIPLTIGDYLASAELAPISTDHPEFRRVEAEVGGRIRRLLGAKGRRTADSFHRDLGRIMWEKCGMARSEAGLKEALARIPALREEFWSDVHVPGSGAALNQSLEHAGRVADFLELGELMCRDALEREESCGGHFRVEYQTDEGEARRDDSRFCYAAAWEWTGEGTRQRLNREPLQFENVATNLAEGSLATAENWLRTSTNAKSAAFTTYSSESPYLFPIGYMTTNSLDPLSMTWTNSNSFAIGGDDTQRYMIEKYGADNQPLGTGLDDHGRPLTGCQKVDVFRITARGLSAKGTIKFVQTIYSVPSC